MLKASTILAGALVAAVATSAAAEGELNLYSSRHYDTDDRLYGDFEEATGITINRIEGKGDELIARMTAEGANSPADILLTVDTSRLARAKEAGVLQSIDSEILEAKVPAYIQDSDNQWFGFSQRARIIFYDKNDVTNPPRTYLDLADPAYQGKICIRSSSNTYNQTLLASIVTHHGVRGRFGLGGRRCRQHGTRSAGRRHRPAARPCVRANATSPLATATTLPVRSAKTSKASLIIAT